MEPFTGALQSERRTLPAPSPDLPGSQPLAGQLVVFTGKLSSLGRREARALVARLGGATADDVTAKTTILVVGAEGFGPAAADRNADKSQKLKRAEDLKIRVLSEEDFCRLAGVPTPTVGSTEQYVCALALVTAERSMPMARTKPRTNLLI